MKETTTQPSSCFLHLLISFSMVCGGAYFIYDSILTHLHFGIFAGVILLIIGFTWMCGLYVLEPNQAAVLIFFGTYVGSVRSNGFHWANPFYTKRKISLRARNLNGKTLKVNDKLGNPIEIAAVLVWQVQDTYAATLEVEQYETFVELQSEAALRHLANAYPYDNLETEATEEPLTLRGGADIVSQQLVVELNDRLRMGGIQVIEGRISHLAYSAEIAGPMLQRQQATAIVAARKQIVEGAVGMVEMALARLELHNTVQLDPERRAAMVSNLLVVLCSERAANPVVNTGTLYN